MIGRFLLWGIVLLAGPLALTAVSATERIASVYQSERATTMTAGVGFGLTRFTVWYNKPHYAFKGV